ncbi:MAG TPA: phospholipase D family protein [Polyangiaceae bacterium]|nr:phospholipase D family protein [Polyangiaceae bacterium]
MPRRVRSRSSVSTASSAAVEPERRLAAVELVVDRRHYDEIVAGALSRAEVSVWIGTANLKDVHLEAPVGTRARARGRYVSITEHFADLVRRGVEIRILHGALPSRPYRASLKKQRELAPPAFEMRHCPRVHLKMIAVDGAYLYLGSANFTGAGLGAKGDGRRNFELGFSTDDDVLLDGAQSRFDRIWRGAECGSCKIRNLCPKPIDQLPSRRA